MENWFSDKVNKSWRSNVQHGDYSSQHCIVHVEVAMGVDFKWSHAHTKTQISEVMNVLTHLISQHICVHVCVYVYI